MELDADFIAETRRSACFWNRTPVVALCNATSKMGDDVYFLLHFSLQFNPSEE
jgi:hypothetical protein